MQSIWMSMEQEELFRKRMEEIADRAYARGIILYSDFLDLYEQNLIHRIPWNTHGVTLQLSGGYPQAERQMAAFVPDALSYAQNTEYPFSCLLIRPAAPKYAEALTHRDYLGAILSLGLDRSRIGDLIIRDNTCCCFCSEKIVPYIRENLNSVRHTVVTACDFSGDMEKIDPPKKELTGTVSSVRLDTVIALGFGLTRSQTGPLIREGHVFVNGRVITTNGYSLKEGDRISVRGKGKLLYGGAEGETRKGRVMIRVWRFI